MTTTATRATVWCPTCRARRVVEDEYATDTGDRYAITSDYYAENLECGHTVTTTTATRPSPL